MPLDHLTFLNDRNPGHQRGSTLFERMQRATNAPPSPPALVEPVRSARAGAAGNQEVLVVEQPELASDGDVRFDRAEIDGLPGIAMQQRQGDGAWREIWSLPTQSIDAREGMFGWFNTQSHRWDRFARMLQRRGPDELTSWIFELMVQPTAAAARPPRVETQPFLTIDQYRSPSTTHAFRYASSAPVDNCVCRRNPRDF